MMQPQSNGVHDREDQKVKKTKYDKRAFSEQKDKRLEYGANRILQRNKDVDTPIRGTTARPRTRKVRTPRKKKENQASPRGANHQIMLQSVKRGRSGAPTASVIEPTSPQNQQLHSSKRQKPLKPPQPHRVASPQSLTQSQSHPQLQPQQQHKHQPQHQPQPQPQPPIPVAVPPDAFKPTKILQRNKDVDMPTAAAIVAKTVEQPQRQKRSKRRSTTARKIMRDAKASEMENARQMMKDTAIQAAAGAAQSNGHHGGNRTDQEMMNGRSNHSIASRDLAEPTPPHQAPPSIAPSTRAEPSRSPLTSLPPTAPVPLQLEMTTPMHVAIDADPPTASTLKLDDLHGKTSNTSSSASDITPPPQVALPSIQPITTSPPPAVDPNAPLDPMKKDDVLSPSIMARPLPPSGNLATGTFYASGAGTIQNVKESAYGVKSTTESVTKVSSTTPKSAAVPAPQPAPPTTPAPKPTLARGNSAISTSNMSTTNLLASIPNSGAFPSLLRQPSDATNLIYQSMAAINRSKSDLSAQHQAATAAAVTRVTQPSTTTNTTAVQRTSAPSRQQLYPTYNTMQPASTSTPPKPPPSAPYSYYYPAQYANTAVTQRTPYPMHSITTNPVQTVSTRRAPYSQSNASTLSRAFGVPNQFTNRWTSNTAHSVQSTPGPQAATNGYPGYGQQRTSYVASTVNRTQGQNPVSYAGPPPNQNANRWTNSMNGTNTLNQQNGRGTPAPRYNQQNGYGPSNGPRNNQQNGGGPGNGWSNNNGSGRDNGWNNNGRNGSNSNGNNGWNNNGSRNDSRDYSRYGGPSQQLRANTPSRPSRPVDPNVCTWYGTASGCRWGFSCFKSHDDPNSRELCPNVDAPWGCKWGDECWFRHEHFQRPEDANRVGRRRGGGPPRSGGSYVPRNGGRERDRPSSRYDEYSDSSTGDISTDDSFDREPASPRSPRRGVNGTMNAMNSMQNLQSPMSLSSQKSVVNVNDLLIQFEKKGEDQCTSLHEGGTCTHLDRMILTLKFYSKWNVVSDAHDKEQFMEFVNEIYVTLLSDYVHIMEKHHDDCDWKREIDVIYKRWGEDFRSYKPCDIKNNNCLLLDVHRKERDEEEEKAESEKIESRELVFYRDLMDSMHCYLLHQHENGFRIRVTDHSRRPNPKHKKWSDDRFHYEYKMHCNRHDVFVFCTDSSVSRTR